MEFKQSIRKGPFWAALRSRGYEIEEFELQDVPMIRLTNKDGKKWLTSTNISYPTTSLVTAQIATNKLMAYDYAERVGISVPHTWHITKAEDVDITVLQQYGYVIVKPLDSHGSQGVTLNINTVDQLVRGVYAALEYSSVALIQQQVVGDELRFTVLDGKVESVLLRQTPRVVGDGKSTIAELITQENTKRRSIKTEYITYPELDERIIDAQYLTDMRVLAENEVLEFNKFTMVKKGAMVYELLDKIHPDYKAIAERAVEDIASSFIVVDLFIQDYTAPASTENYWFNEFNTSPALVMYYTPVNKDTSRVAGMIVDKFDTMIAKGL